MNQVPQADIAEIKSRLGQVERGQSRIEGKLADMDEGLDDRIELAMRRLFEKSGRANRDMASWVLSLIIFALLVISTITSIAFGLWG